MRARGNGAAHAVLVTAAGCSMVSRWWGMLALSCCVLVVGCSTAGRPPVGRAQDQAAEAIAAVPRNPPAPPKAALVNPPRPEARQENAEEGPAPAVQAPREPVLADQVGLASWYGGKFHRRRTASGELFDMRALTAAHPTLPFGSLVCVRSTVNGRTVVVRINDRGPHTGKRVIDLSRAAAEELGMIGLGLKPVELFALEDGDQECPAP
jgi:rare lipoprotein A